MKAKVPRVPQSHAVACLSTWSCGAGVCIWGQVLSRRTCRNFPPEAVGCWQEPEQAPGPNPQITWGKKEEPEAPGA